MDSTYVLQRTFCLRICCMPDGVSCIGRQRVIVCGAVGRDPLAMQQFSVRIKVRERYLSCINYLFSFAPIWHL